MAINPLQGTFRVLCRVGLSTDIPPLKLAEIGWDTDTNTFRVGNGTATPAKIPTNLSTAYFDYSAALGFKFSTIDLVSGGKIDGVDPSQLKQNLGFVKYEIGSDSFRNLNFITDGKVVFTEVGNTLTIGLSPSVPTGSQLLSLQSDLTALTVELNDFEAQFAASGIAVANGSGNVILKSLESPDNTILITEDSDSFNISVNPASGVFAGISNLYNNAIASDGFLVHSGVNFVNRIFATSSDLTLTNANGTGGNPTFGLAVPSQSDIDDGVSTKALSPATLSLMTIGGTLFNTLSGKFAASNLETTTGTSTTKFTTPSSINALLTGKAASQGEIDAGIIGDKFGTPVSIKGHIDNRIAIESEIATGTSTTKFPSAKAVKDYVNTVITGGGSYLALTGGNLSGNVTFTDASEGVFVGTFGSGNGFVGGDADAADWQGANTHIKSWWGIGFTPSATGQLVSIGDMSHFFDTRNGSSGQRGDYLLGRKTGETRSLLFAQLSAGLAQTSGWSITVDDTNFMIHRHNSSGVFQNTPFYINQSTGQINITNKIDHAVSGVTGTLYNLSGSVSGDINRYFTNTSTNGSASITDWLQTGLANTYHRTILYNNAGSPYLQRQAGTALVALYEDIDLHILRTTAGAEKAVFGPAIQLKGPVYVCSDTPGNTATKGYTFIDGGTVANTGNIGFFAAGGTRLGYVGAGDTNYLYIAAENGRRIRFQGTLDPMFNDGSTAVKSTQGVTGDSFISSTGAFGTGNVTITWNTTNGDARYALKSEAQANYQGTDGNLLNYPVGTILLVVTNVSVNRNAVADVSYHSSDARYFALNGDAGYSAGLKLTGTWRCRGQGNASNVLIQRVS